MATSRTRLPAGSNPADIIDGDTDPGEHFPVTAGVDDDETPAARVAAMLDGADDIDRGRLSVYKLNGASNQKGARPQWCGDFDPSEFESLGLGTIRARWGAGDYKIVLMGAIPNGKGGKPGFGTIRAAVISLAPDVDGGMTPPARQSDDLSRVLEAMATNQREFQTQLLAAIQQRPDPMAEMQRMMTLAGSMREAFGMSGGRERGNSLTEIVSAMRMMREVSSEFGTPKPEKDEDPLLALAGPLLETLKAFAVQRVAPAVAQAPAPVEPQAPALPVADAGVPIVPEQPPQTEDEMKIMLLLKVREAIGALIVLKTQGAAPDSDVVVEYLNEHLPDEGVEALRDPEWLKTLTAVDGRVGEHAAWFTAVRDYYIALPEDDAP